MVYISNSRGELHWVLPLVTKLSKIDYKVSIYFDSYSPEFIIKDDKLSKLILDDFNINIYSQKNFINFNFIIDSILTITTVIGFKIISEKIINRFISRYFDFFSLNKSNTLYKFFKPNILLKDVGNDRKVRLDLSRITRKKGGEVIMFPHGTEIFVEDKPHSTSFCADKVLVSSLQTSDYYSKKFVGIKSKIIGIPRYDKNWLKFLKSNFKTPSNKAKKYKILFITRGPHPSDLLIDDFSYIFKSVFEVCSDMKNV